MPTPDIRPWPISPHCRALSARLGFDPDTPEQMIATPNEDAQRLMALMGGSGSTGAAPSRRRFVAGIGLGSLVAFYPDPLHADFLAVPENLRSGSEQIFAPHPPVLGPLSPEPTAISDTSGDLILPDVMDLIGPFPAIRPEAVGLDPVVPSIDAPHDLPVAAEIIPPTLDPHPPIVSLPEPPPLREALPLPIEEPVLTSWWDVIGSAMPSAELFWSTLPEVLLASAAWLIWRELRQVRLLTTANKMTDPVTTTDMESKEMAAVAESIEEEIEAVSPWQITVGGASHCGQARSENQDAYAMRDIAPGIALAITCDGVGGKPGGRVASRYASRKLKTRLCLGLTIGLSAEEALRDALTQCADQMEVDGIEGLTTTLITLVDGDRLIWAGLGDGRICVIHPDGMAQDVMAPHHALNMPSNIITAHLAAGRYFTPRLGSLHLEPGSLVFTMSDGAGEILDLNGLAKIRAGLIKSLKQTGPELFADGLLTRLEALKHPETGQPLHDDNLTLTVILNEQREGTA